MGINKPDVVMVHLEARLKLFGGIIRSLNEASTHLKIKKMYLTLSVKSGENELLQRQNSM